MIPGILLVLKIIGIILLGILLLLLSAAMLLLFVPIRYKIKAKKEDALEAEAKVTWLLSLLSIRFRYKEEKIILVQLFGIPIYDNRKAEEKQQKKQKKQDRREQKKAKQEKNQEKKHKKKQKLENSVQLEWNETSEPPYLEENTQTSEHSSQKTVDSSNDAKKEEKKELKIYVFFKKMIVILKKIRKSIINGTHTIQKIYDRIKQLGNTISYYYTVWNREETQKAYRLCKHSVHRIWKQVRPRKLRAFLKVGTDDPAVTGQILVFYSMCYPYVGKSVTIEPDFEQFILEGNLFIKGKITIFVLLCVAWKLFFDKNIRSVLALLKKEEL